MKLKEIVDLLEIKVWSTDFYNPEKDINFAFSCDLMSDALMLLRRLNKDTKIEECILITGLVTNQSIRTAEMLDIEVILYVRDKKPSQTLIELANESGITLLSTKYLMYTTNGKLYSRNILGATDAIH